MLVKQIKDAAKLAFASKVTLCLVGNSGTSKTSIFKQIYKDLGFDRVLIIRPGLFSDSADLVGLPEFVVIDGEKRTGFMSPDWLPLKHEKVLIVVDEINRGDKQVANALFGLIEAECPTVGQYVLPEGCKVVATCNPPTKRYRAVIDLGDEAWSSRMSFVKISPSLDEFAAYGLSTGNVDNIMLDFLRTTPEFYKDSSDFEIEVMFKDSTSYIATNNRSKEKVSQVFINGKKMKTDESIMFELIRGIGGLEFASQFMKYAKENYNGVTVDHVLTGEILSMDFDFKKVSNLSNLMSQLEQTLVKRELDNKETDNYVEFLLKIPRDLLFGHVISFLNDPEKDIPVSISQAIKSNQRFLKAIENNIK